MFRHDAQFLKSPVLLADANTVLSQSWRYSKLSEWWVDLDPLLINGQDHAASLPRSLLSLGRGVELNVKVVLLSRYNLER